MSRPLKTNRPEDKKEDKEKPSEETPPGRTTLRLSGTLPPEVWNRLGTKLITKLRSGNDLKIDVGFSVSVDAKLAGGFEAELRQVLEDLGIQNRIMIEKS